MLFVQIFMLYPDMHIHFFSFLCVYFFYSTKLLYVWCVLNLLISFFLLNGVEFFNSFDVPNSFS